MLTYTNQSEIVGGTPPSLSLNFITKAYRRGVTAKPFGDIITLARSSGAGRFNESGQYEWMAANTPRFDYDPVTLQAKGILIEEQRANLFTRSSEFADAAWVTGKTAGAAVESNTAVAPDGTTTADTLTLATGVDFLYRGFPNYSVTSGSSITYTLHSNTPNRLTYFGGASPTGSDVYNATDIGGGFYRQTLTRTFNETTSTKTLQVLISGIAGAFTLWGAQLEVGASPSSYIPTTTAQITRSADVASVNVLSPWYRADEGTLFVHGAARRLTTNGGLANIGTASEYSVLLQQTSTGISGNSLVGGVNVASMSLANGDGVTAKAAMAFKKNDFAMAVGGILATPDTSGNLFNGTGATLKIGNFGGTANFANGHIREIRYYPRRLTDAELQTLTT